MTDGTGGVQAVERALAILDLFDERTEELTIAAAAARLGVHRSTASRLLGALERHGLLEQHNGNYRLGLGLVSLAGLVLNRFPARAAARDVLRRLRDEVGETVYLGLLDGRDVVYIDQASAPSVSVNVDWVGYRQPLTAGATGSLLLAFQPADVVDELLAAATDETWTPPGELELAAIRRSGYLVRRSGPPGGGGAGAAAAIRDHRGLTVAALSVWGPQDRVEPRLDGEVLPALLRAAARISESLGYRAA
jgi:DNA-binding IclR family transcriptional regulator